MKTGGIPLTTALCIIGFIVFQVSGSLCLRMASERSGLSAFYFFAAGNAVGFVGTVFLTLALRGQQPNLIYALCQGGGFCALQLAAYLLFSMPLSTIQWCGIGLIASGVVCVQFRP
jgi:multidrug transporter EmrE-like cation transporter